MPIKRLFVFLVLIQLPVVMAFSQEGVRISPIRYFNSFGISMLTNEDEVLSGGFTTIHGIASERFKAGAGVGITGYKNWRTYPVFLSGTMNLHNPDKAFGLYVQLNAGHAFANWLLKSEWTSNEDVTGGVMINPMLGYRFIFGKPSVHIATGYLFQRLKYQYNLWGTDYFIKEELNRFILQISIGLN